MSFCANTQQNDVLSGRDNMSSFWKILLCNKANVHSLEVSVPEHPWADVSSESWTSLESPALPGWRPRPRRPGYKVWSPWTAQSGRSGCWETAPLQEEAEEKRINKNVQEIQALVCCHVGQGAPSSLLLFSSPPSVLGLFGSVLFDFLHPRLQSNPIVLHFRIIPPLDKSGIIRLNPLPVCCHCLLII